MSDEAKGLARRFRAELEEIRAALHAVSASLADSPWRAGGWTRKEILGHMLDSAANNRHRFVGAAIDGRYEGSQYDQKPWVNAHGYADQEWETLLRWWDVEHEILASVVDRIPEERLEAECRMSEEPAVTLRFLIEDYVPHQRGHLEQIASGAGIGASSAH